MFKYICFIIFVLIIFLVGNSNYENPDKYVLCHFKYKIIDIGNCVNKQNDIECAISYKSDKGLQVHNGVIDGLVMKNQEVYEYCYNDKNKKRCYVLLKTRLKTKYENYCPATKRYVNYYDGKAKSKTVFEAFLSKFLE